MSGMGGGTQRIVLGIVLIALVWGTGCSAVREAAPRQPPTLKDLFVLASHRDTQGLLQLELIVAASPDVTLAVGFPIALYLADPERFALRFAEAFPTTYGELMLGLHHIEAAGVQPEPDFAIRSIGALARRGSATAARKLVVAYTHADGELAESLFEEVRKLLGVNPRAALSAYALLGSAERLSFLRGLRGHLSGSEGVPVAKSIQSLGDLSEEEEIAAAAIMRALGE